MALPQSTFYMLRCVVAVACADNVVKEQELIFLRALLSHFKRHMIVSADQVAQLKEDLKTRQHIDALLPHVTERGDREQLILFAGLLAQSDGDLHPAEEEILLKIRALSGPSLDIDEPVPGPPNGHPPSMPSHAPVIQAAAAPPQGPKMDMNSFMQEVRDVVKQEFYKQAIATSGVAPKTSRAAVVDAFAEKSPSVPHKSSYDVLAETPKLSAAMRQNLVPEERLLGKARFHYIYTVYSLLYSAILISLSRLAATQIPVLCRAAQQRLLVDGADWVGTDNIPAVYKALENPHLATWPAGVLFVTGIVYFLWRLAVQFTTEIIVTDSRVVVKQGIFNIRTFKADLQGLGQVDVYQSMLGNILGYGKVHIYTQNWSGKGNQMEAEGIFLPPIAEPHAFSTLVDRARRMWRTRSI